ncbi:hypothetical protein F8S20_30685 [Nostoc sp. BAE]|nr:hypothetical protein [Nostoc commune BAE]
MISGVGGRKTMFEKLLLAVTITFSLNFLFQVRVPEQHNSATYGSQPEQSAAILVTKLKK